MFKMEILEFSFRMTPVNLIGLELVGQLAPVAWQESDKPNFKPSRLVQPEPYKKS